MGSVDGLGGKEQSQPEGSGDSSDPNGHQGPAVPLRGPQWDQCYLMSALMR